MNLQSKFQCHYRLAITYPENNDYKTSIVTDPTTIHFNIRKQTYQSINTAKITIYNLDGYVRESIYQDKLLLEQIAQKEVVLQAGYGNTLTTCLTGHIQSCYTQRQGVDMVTTIEVIDPNFLTQYSTVTFDAGTTYKEAIANVASQMPDIKLGEVGQFNGTFSTPTTFSDNSFTVINEITGGYAFIDNGVLNCLNANEVLSNYGAYLIDSETGLLGTPKRYDAVLEIEMLFEPTIRMGQLVEIVSSTQSRFNKQYKVIGIEHDCLISESSCGRRTTKLQLLYADHLKNSNVNVTHNPQGSSTSFIINNKATPINSNITSDVSKAYEYIKKTNGGIPQGKINSLVSWADMIGHGNKANERFQEITKGKLANCVAVADRLERFVNTYFRGRKVTVTSGWRSTANNFREKGANKSQHLVGLAIDFSVNGVSADKVFMAAKSSNMFKGVGRYSTFTHVDTRG